MQPVCEEKAKGPRSPHQGAAPGDVKAQAAAAANVQRRGGGGAERPRGRREESATLAEFLQSKRPAVEAALQQNETVDVFKDAFASVGDEGGRGNKGENELKELRTFNDIVYSKNMSLCDIDWHRRRRACADVAPVRNLNFDSAPRSATRRSTRTSSSGTSWT